MKKKKFCFTKEELRFIMHTLNWYRTKLVEQGKYTDTVDETLYKFINACTKRVKVEG